MTLDDIEWLLDFSRCIFLENLGVFFSGILFHYLRRWMYDGFTMSRCPDVSSVTTPIRQQGGWVHSRTNMIIIIIIIIIFIRSWQTATNYKNKLIDQSINAFVQHSENEISLS